MPGPAVSAIAGGRSPRLVTRRLTRDVPHVRTTLAASVVIGLVSTSGVVVQALALAHLLASAMPHVPAAGRVAAMVWLGVGVAIRAAAGLAGELVARLGAAATKAELRQRLLHATLTSATGKASPADTALLAGRGIDALDVYVGRCLPDLVLAVAAPIALVVVAAALDWLSALVLLVAVGLFPLFGALVGRASASLAADRWRQVEVLGRRVADVFAGLPTLRALGRSAEQRTRIADASEALRTASTRTLRVAFLSAFVLDTLASVSVALVAVPLGLRLLGGSISLSAALAVLVVAPEVFIPLRRASAEFHESTEGLAAAGRVLSVLDGAAQARPEATGTAVAVPDPAHVGVRLRAVGVDVPGRDRPLLDDADLVLAPGETVALVGDSGAGKSTVCSLLLGFRHPDRGAVTAGDVDLRHLDPAGWRHNLTYLPEHPVLLDATLADNLRLARPEASDGELLEALRLAGAPDLVGRLPQGLATRLGAGGRKASAGERQRIALARVLLRPSPLVVLDEPTVHLDPEAEDRVLRSLATMLEGATALVVTHRPAALALADRVVTMANGRFEPVDHRRVIDPATMAVPA